MDRTSYRVGGAGQRGYLKWERQEFRYWWANLLKTLLAYDMMICWQVLNFKSIFKLETRESQSVCLLWWHSV